MNKRQQKKRNKSQWALFIDKNAWYNEMKEDSVAHLVKSYFETGCIHNKELFEYDKETSKILVSKKALNHLLKLCGSALIEHNYDFELVDEIKVLWEEQDGTERENV